MSQPVENKKIEELRKKISRLEKEYEKSVKALDEQKEKTKKKKAELEKAQTEMVSELLVSNNMTIADLADMLAKSDANTNSSESSNNTY